MQAVRIKNRLSLHSVWDFTFKTSGSLSVGKVDHFQRGQHGSVSFGISSRFNRDLYNAFLDNYEAKCALFDSLKEKTEA